MLITCAVLSSCGGVWACAVDALGIHAPPINTTAKNLFTWPTSLEYTQLAGHIPQGFQMDDGGIWTQRICYLPLFFVHQATPNGGSWSRRAIWRLAKRCASSGNAAAPQMVNKVKVDQDIVVWVTTPSIQSTANAPVMPSSASATGPYASPPTTVLVAMPVRIPIVSNHQRASIRRVSPQTRWR